MFEIALLAVAVISGATASVAGFGIGSMLTPLLATQVGTSTAVAAVTIPHAIATALRCWRLRASIDRTVLVRFGILSAAGALAGALLYTRLGSKVLTIILGMLLVLTAIAQLTGWSSRWRPRQPLIGIFGILSGFFGGVAGNQGGLRAAALTAFDLSPAQFVATATAAGVVGGAARTPVFLVSAGNNLIGLTRFMSIAIVGVLIGTLAGERVLLGMSRQRFARVIGTAIGLLGVWLVVSSFRAAE